MKACRKKFDYDPYKLFDLINYLPTPTPTYHSPRTAHNRPAMPNAG
ncbi:MAG TPA: hypothetical protein PK239_13935 [Chitinophagales bacterium]|nr:hypothetical protein [Chitinophagales bacterium]